jgi:hypothetical protein
MSHGRRSVNIPRPSDSGKTNGRGHVMAKARGPRMSESGLSSSSYVVHWETSARETSMASDTASARADGCLRTSGITAPNVACVARVMSGIAISTIVAPKIAYAQAVHPRPRYHTIISNSNTTSSGRSCTWDKAPNPSLYTLEIGMRHESLAGFTIISYQTAYMWEPWQNG